MVIFVICRYLTSFVSLLPSPPPPPPLPSPPSLPQFIQGNLALYIKYSLGLGDQYPYLIAILLISTILWMPLWQFVMIKLGKKTAFAIALWQFAPALLMMLFVTYVPYLVYPLVIYGGLGVSALYLIPW